MNLELLDRAAGQTTCQILEEGGGALVGAGAIGILTGGVGFVPFATGAAMLLAHNYGCKPMPLGDAVGSNPAYGGCAQLSPGGYGQFEVKYPGGDWEAQGGQVVYGYATRLGDTGVNQRADGSWSSECYVYGEELWFLWQSPDDNRTEAEANATQFRIRPIEGECAYDPDAPTKPFPPEMYEPRPYTDEVTNCNFNITFQGMAQPVPGGPVKPVYLLQQGAGDGDGQRADGGVMGGCNWPDTIFMPSDNGPDGPSGPNGPVYIPVPDGPFPPNGPDGVPWWAEPLLAGATNAALTLIGQGIDNLTAPKLPPGEFTLQAPCDVDEEGNPLTQSWTYPEQNFESRSIAHQITMLEALQTHLNWKTPTCNSNERPKPEGQWVTTRWISDEKMDHSNHRLRKLFRYRTKSSRDLGQLSTYWKDFVWTAGDVCVVHKGAWWGNPQVWASTEAEGQRVIRHAATEAGLDPDQDGEWAFSSSNSPRYGMPGTMRIQMHEGFPWVAKREGASYPNTLALAHDP
jgi:hypothetical protein